MNPIILVVAGISLLGLGLGLGYWFARSQRKLEATRADDIQKELDNYRQHVTEHFGETAQQFQEIGQQYQSLYKHMAQGASALCDPAQSETLLSFAAGSAPLIVAGNDQPENPPEVIRDYAIAEEIEPPEVIRDYAAAEEIEPPQVEPDAEATTAEEPLDNLTAETADAEDSPAPEVTTAEPSVEEDIAEQVAPPAAVEKERTVH